MPNRPDSVLRRTHTSLGHEAKIDPKVAADRHRDGD
jgi:hypothetical protein